MSVCLLETHSACSLFVRDPRLTRSKHSPSDSTPLPLCLRTRSLDARASREETSLSSLLPTTPIVHEREHARFLSASSALSDASGC